MADHIASLAALHDHSDSSAKLWQDRLMKNISFHLIFLSLSCCDLRPNACNPPAALFYQHICAREGNECRIGH